MNRIFTALLYSALSLTMTFWASMLSAQAVTAQQSAPIDITGNWVALVTEDWRFRMITAPAGDYPGISLNQAGQQIATAWDPIADTAAGDQCKAYGAAGIMRIPTRLNISWASENVLSIETDAGMQTRLLKFSSAQDNIGAGSLQGVSKARWDIRREGRGGPVVGGNLEVTTTDMMPGYFRRNGVPYSDQASMTEYFEIVTQDDGTQYLIIIAELTDPVYLNQPVLASTNFKRESDNSKWNPGPCVAQ